MGRNAGCWWLTADPSRRPGETRRYAWESVAFDDQEVGVPAPHNSALVRVFTRSPVDRARSRTAIGPAALASGRGWAGWRCRPWRTESQRGKIQMRPCEPAVITNCRRVYAPSGRGATRGLRERHARACVRAFTARSQPSRRRRPSARSLSRVLPTRFNPTLRKIPVLRSLWSFPAGHVAVYRSGSQFIDTESKRDLSSF